MEEIVEGCPIEVTVSSGPWYALEDAVLAIEPTRFRAFRRMLDGEVSRLRSSSVLVLGRFCNSLIAAGVVPPFPIATLSDAVRGAAGLKISRWLCRCRTTCGGDDGGEMCSEALTTLFFLAGVFCRGASGVDSGVTDRIVELNFRTCGSSSALFRSSS